MSGYDNYPGLSKFFLIYKTEKGLSLYMHLHKVVNLPLYYYCFSVFIKIVAQIYIENKKK